MDTNDSVSNMLNDMRMSPELLHQYSEKAKQVLPELNGGNTSLINNRNMTPEQQLEILQQTRMQDDINNTVSDSSSLNSSVSTEYEPQTGGTTNNKMINIKYSIFVFFICFVLLIPKVNIYLNKLLNVIFSPGTNILFLNLFKALLGSLVYYVVSLSNLINQN